MNFRLILSCLLTIASTIFAEEVGSVNVYITIPSTNNNDEGEGESPEQISIDTFYIGNHQYYSLSPSDLSKNVKQKPPLLEKALFELSSLLQGKCLALPLTIKKQKSNDQLVFSLTQEQTDTFKLLSIHGHANSIVVKLYLIDLKGSLTLENAIELKAGQKYPAKEVEGKLLFLLLANSNCPSDLNEHYLPLKVHYESL
jgi:hypothetical protein